MTHEESVALIQLRAYAPAGWGWSIGQWNGQWTVSVWDQAAPPVNPPARRKGVYAVGATLREAVGDALKGLEGEIIAQKIHDEISLGLMFGPCHNDGRGSR